MRATDPGVKKGELCLTADILGASQRPSRCFSDAEDETHFDDEIRLPRTATQFAASTAIAWTSESVSLRNLVWRRVEKDEATTPPHVPRSRRLAISVSGGAEIEVSTRQRPHDSARSDRAGEDLICSGHSTRYVDGLTPATRIPELGEDPQAQRLTDNLLRERIFAKTKFRPGGRGMTFHEVTVTGIRAPQSPKLLLPNRFTRWAMQRRSAGAPPVGRSAPAVTP